jgi:hypothetical protein
MMIRNISNVLPTKNTSSKIISKISNGWELNIPYLAMLGDGAVMMMSENLIVCSK